MRTILAKDAKLVLPEAALSEVFDECDRHERDETGGRIIGSIEEVEGETTFTITGLIEPGPLAQRSQTFLQQDGDFQERVFREVEAIHPEIEHLGTWHTHHVNGLQTLSSGDLETYFRTVNHPKHNIPFFYALLVVAKRRTKDPLSRYSVKHYFFRRGDEYVYEIPADRVELVKAPLVYPVRPTGQALGSGAARARTKVAMSDKVATACKEVGGKVQRSGARVDRVYDRDLIGEFFPDVRPFSSPKLGLFWRGNVELIDGSLLEVVVVEGASETSSYSIVLRQQQGDFKHNAEELAQRDYPSARAALVAVERSCNRALFDKHGGQA